MAMNTAFVRLLQLLLLLLPPSLRDYPWAAPSDHGVGQKLQAYHPIIMSAGISCPVLEARLTDAYTPSLPRCGAFKGKGWFPLWNSKQDLVDHDYVSCFEEQMSLVFDPVTNDYRNQPGVETRVPDFGSAYGFSYKDDSCPFCCNVKLRNELEALGYRDGDTLFGVPYDIRHAPPRPGQPSEVYSDYFARVKDLVQNASAKNGNKPVIFVGHSFGGKLILDFVNSTPLSWRKQFIKHLVLLSPTPPTGFLEALKNLASGPSCIHFDAAPHLALRTMWWSFASSLLSLPSPTVFTHEPLIITKHRNYSAYDYPDFFAALGFSMKGMLPFTKWVFPTNMRVEAPMVPTTYLSGFGIQTINQVVFWDGNFDVYPENVYGNGDGVVNWNSVLVFANELKRQHCLKNILFKFIKIPNVTHGEIASQDNSLKIIMAEILEANS
ncbi:lecithin-cholesterol acyltransferase-like 1 [Lolium rigidum]|uniref:lecithin-cholesterol acyltransferase-like 1 n=1 Tax=Lolium rigidum TaxID=89674 RepID=UPI001F5E2AB8|nr:lecithin-cholesterol acyltransferase-like 1 [Lolium rigidum]